MLLREFLGKSIAATFAQLIGRVASKRADAVSALGILLFQYQPRPHH